MRPRPRPIVVVLGGADLPGIDAIKDHAVVRHATGARVADELPGAEVLFVWRAHPGTLTSAWAKADTLRWVHMAGAGTTGLPATGDLLVTTSRGLFDEPIAEYV